MVLWISGAGIVGWGTYRDLDWNTVKPVWMLRYQARTGSESTASVAFEELIRRFYDKEISAEQASSIVEDALRIQADSFLAHSARAHTARIHREQQLLPRRCHLSCLRPGRQPRLQQGRRLDHLSFRLGQRRPP